MRHALTWYVLQENFSFKTEHLDSERLMVSCKDDSCPWLARAICCKSDNVQKITKCKGPHTCDKIQNAHNGRMIDSVFLAYVLELYIREDPAYKIKNLRHVSMADLKHEVSHYKVFFNLHSFFNTTQRHQSSVKYKHDIFPKTHEYFIL